MNHTSHALSLSALLTALLLGSGALAQNAAPTAVEFTHPSTGSVQRWVKLPGTIRPKQEATLYAKVPGYLKSITVDKGDSVKVGAVLAALETPELSADLTRYRAEVEATQAEYQRLQHAATQAPDLVMPVELDRAKGKYEIAKATLERTQTLLGFNRITAPFSGTITKRFVDPGAFIPAATSGSAAQTAAVVTLMDFSAVRVQVAVPESEAALVQKNLPVKFSVTGLPDKIFESKITRFSYALDDASKTMLVETEITNPKSELRPGMYATVQLALERHDNVMLIPSAALVMEKANAFAYTVDGAKAKKRAIKIGFNDGKHVEVSSGLTASDSVILVGKKTLSDGMAITATEAKP